jgi:hypothetical protein
MAIQVDEGGGLVTYDTHKDIVRVINSQIGTRYRLGLCSAAAHGHIAADLGQFGKGKAVQRILDGTYVFPPGTDPEVVALLEEAAFIQAKMDEMSTAERDATVEEFIAHWHSAQEKTSSSDSGRHFGHYIAASDDVELSTLHVESLNTSQLVAAFLSIAGDIALLSCWKRFWATFSLTSFVPFVFLRQISTGGSNSSMPGE